MFFVLRIISKAGWSKEVYVAKVGETFITTDDLKDFLKQVISSKEQLAKLLQCPVEHVQILCAFVEQKHGETWQEHVDEIVRLALESRYEIKETSLNELVKKLVEN